MFHHLLQAQEPRTVLEHDIALYGWTVVWEFACYVTDTWAEEIFGVDEARPKFCAATPTPAAVG